MNRLLVVILLAGALCATMVFCSVILSPAQGNNNDENIITPELPAAEPNPVVSAFPYALETEFEHDPFEPDRVRSSKQVTKSVVLVRADGSTELKRVNW